MYVETIGKKNGSDIIFCSFERTDIMQITYITFFSNRFSILINDSLKSMATFRIQSVLEDGTWSARYNIPKIDRYSDS